MAKAFYGDILLKGNKALQLEDGDTNKFSLSAAAAMSADLSFTLPAADGSADQALVTSGGGVFSFKSFQEPVSAGDGIDFSSNTISTDLKASGGLKIDATELAVEPADFAGDGLEDDGSDNLRLDLKASGGLKFDTGEVAVEPADFAGDGLEDDGSDNLRLDLKASGGLKFDTGEVAVEPADFAGTGLEDDGSDNLQLDIDGMTPITGVADADTIAIDDGDGGTNRKITRANFIGSAEIAMQSNKISGLADGTAANDAVNKSQLDAAVAGLSWKSPVRLKSNANIASLTGITAADFDGTGQGVTLTSGDRVLLGNDQTTGSERGLYEYDGADLVRPSDFDGAGEAEGAAVFVQEGTDADKGYTQTADSVTIDTTAQSWSQFTGGGSLTAGDGIDIAGSTISADLKASGGLKIDSTEIAVEPADFAGSGLEDDGSDNLRIAAAAAGDGLQGGAGSALAVDVSDFAGEGLEDDGSENLRVKLDGSTIARSASGIKVDTGAIGETELDNQDGAVDAQSFVLPTGYTAGAGTVAAGDTIDAAIRKLDGNIAAIDAAGQFAADWASGDGTSKTVNHALGTKDVIVQIYDKANDATIEVDSVVRTDTDNVDLTSSEAPNASGWRVLILSL